MPDEMNLSDYIAALNELLEEHGDLKVLTSDHSRMSTFYACRAAPLPQLAYRKVAKSKREYIPKFWDAHDDDESCSQRGEPVIRV